MTITFIAGSTDDTAAGTSVSPAIPTGTATNDLMIAICGNGVTATPVWADDGGGQSWTQLDTNAETGGRDTNVAIYYKLAGASESAPTFDFGGTSARLAVAVITLRGIDTGTPFDVTYSNASHYVFGLNSGNATAQPITTANNGAWVILCDLQTASSLSAWGAPSNYTLRQSVVGIDRNVAIATREIATAGTETPGAWTSTGPNGSEENQNYTLAVRAASAGGGSIPPIIHSYRQRRT